MAYPLSLRGTHVKRRTFLVGLLAPISGSYPWARGDIHVSHGLPQWSRYTLPSAAGSTISLPPARYTRITIDCRSGRGILLSGTTQRGDRYE